MGIRRYSRIISVFQSVNNSTLTESTIIKVILVHILDLLAKLVLWEKMPGSAEATLGSSHKGIRQTETGCRCDSLVLKYRVYP